VVVAPLPKEREVIAKVEASEELEEEVEKEVEGGREAKPMSEPVVVAALAQLEEEPEPVEQSIKIVSWRMGKGDEGESLSDESGQVELLSQVRGKSIRAIAPDPVPYSGISICVNCRAFVYF